MLMATNLPYHLTDFIGRKEDLVVVQQLLRSRRLALERTRSAGRIDITARIASALERFWTARSMLSEGRYWYETLLASPNLSALQRSLILQQVVEILRFQGDYARAFLEEHLLLLQSLDDKASLPETPDQHLP
jgi:hypothetical protein